MSLTLPSINEKGAKQNTLIPIGELLVQAGLTNPEQINEALLHVRERGLPIGKVLSMLGYIKQKDVLVAIEAQSLINDSLLSKELAAKAVVLAIKNSQKLHDALKQLGHELPAGGTTRNRLGELLVEAGGITKKDLGNSLITCNETGLPLGRILLFRKVISAELLFAALAGQRLMREGLITRDQAIKGLKSIVQRQSNIQDSFAEWGFAKLPGKRSSALGELLLQSGILEYNQLLTAMEISLTQEKPVGEVFIEQRLIPRNILKAALKLQEMIDNGTLACPLAAKALREINSSSCSVSNAVAKVGLPKLGIEQVILLKDLLTLSGMVDAAEMSQIDDRENSSNFPNLLLASGVLSEAFLDDSLRCIYLIEQKFFEQEDAIMALHYCQTNSINIDDALKELTWTVPTRRRL